MIKIESKLICNALENAIIEYNERISSENNFEKIPVFDSSKGISEEDVGKIKRFMVVPEEANISLEEAKMFSQEMELLMDFMPLSSLIIDMQNLTSKKSTIKIDLSFLEKLNTELRLLRLEGIDLSELKAHSLERLKGLKTLILCKSNITNFGILENLEESIFLNLENNPISDEYSEKIVGLIKKHKGKVLVSNKSLLEYANAVKNKRITFSRYCELAKDFDFSNIDGLMVELDEEIGESKEDITVIIQKAQCLKNIPLSVTPDEYRRIMEVDGLAVQMALVISDASQLTVTDLKQFSNIKMVQIKDRDYVDAEKRDSLRSVRPQTIPYTRDEYFEIRKSIDGLIASNSPVKVKCSEKERFSKIYKALINYMKYNEYSITDKGREDDILNVKDRNLYGGLVEKQCVCGGDSEILRNVCACMGIECNYVDGIGAGRKSGIGHAWNQVKLDGEWFNTDLTGDRDAISNGNDILPFFLKATKDFGHEEYKSLFPEEERSRSDIEEKCTRSISDFEQVGLFLGVPQIDNIVYLGKAVKEAAKKGLLASTIEKVGLWLKGDKKKEEREK